MINTAHGVMTALRSHINIKFCIQSSTHSLHKTNTGPDDAFEFTKRQCLWILLQKNAMFYRDYTDQTNFIFEETSR